MSAIDSLIAVGEELVRVALGSRCVVCAGELPVRRRVASVCVDCWSGLPRLDEARCTKCALPLPSLKPRESRACLRCRTEPLETSWIDSWGRYDSSLTKVLHAFKFAGHAFLAEPLAELLVGVLHARAKQAFDVIVPVPMFRPKERRRGYNQAELLAREVAKRFRLPCNEKLLRKVVEGRTQTELRKEDRRANVKGSFEADPAASGLRVLLIDDVCTTGETLSACAAELRSIGATDAAAVTVARTP